MQLTQNHMRLFWLTVCVSCSVLLQASDRDSAGRNKTSAAVREMPATSRMFTELEAYIPAQQFRVNNQPEFTSEFFEQFNATDPVIEEYKAKARAAINLIESTNSFIDYLEPSDINKLPVGLRKKVGNTEIIIAVSSAVFTPTYAKLTVFARVNIPQPPYQIFFGVTNLQLSYNGGIIGAAKLALLGDIAIPINGDNAALVLKGGFNIESGQVTESATYITMDCNGFKELGLTAEVQFPRSMLLPVDELGKIIDGRVACGFTNLKVSNWNDILATVSFETPFQVNGLPGFIFEVTNAAFDFSDIRNNPDIAYPAGYVEKYLQADAINTWRGVYVKELSIALPEAFKDRTVPDQRISFGVTDLIVDNNGLTGVFYGENILPFHKGTASGWKFSVDDLQLALEANHLVRAGFNGRIGLPLSTDDDTANKRKVMGYSAVIAADGEYVCRVTTLDSLDFDVWKAKVILKPNSYIQLTGNAALLKPEAMLHGSMGIMVQKLNGDPDPSGEQVADFRGITFEGLHLQTEAPYISAQYFGYTGEVRLGDFPVTISNIALSAPLANNERAISMTLKVHLHENEFTGSTRFDVVGQLQENNSIRSWQFKRVELKEVEIKANVKDAFTLDGKVTFHEDDPVYGDGFAGTIKAIFTKGVDVSVDVNAVFGKKNTFRYWYVDGKADLGTGIGGFIKVQGFGGGAYYRMKKDGYDPAFSPTGMKYTPDSTAGLGVKAAVIFSVGDKKLAKGEAAFEIAFNRGGGMRYIGLFGYAKMLGNIPGLGGSVTDFVAAKYKEIEDRLQSISMDTGTLNRLKILQPSVAASHVYQSSETPGEQGFSAYIGIQYDFNARTLHASFDLYVNAAGGFIQGAASGNRAGWAVLHVAPSEWYLHIGRPDDRIGIKFGIGNLRIRTGAYFMAGHNIPAFPPPPAELVSILQRSGLRYDNGISENDIAAGRGLAFGANVDVSTGDIRFLFFYANFAAGLGFDVMIKDYGNAHCAGSSIPIGVDGWYAKGQAYAYFQGELGIRIKIMFIRKKISIIKGGAAAILQAKLPNPTWVGGQMGFYVNILGGLINGRFNMKFSFGQDCQIEYDEGIDFEDFKIVRDVTPAENATNVSVIAKPQVIFNLRPGKQMEWPREDGSGNDVMMPMLESFKLYQGSTEIPATLEYNAAGDVLTMTPKAVLQPNTTYKMVTRITMRELKNGYWITISENGQVAEEIKEYTFTTGPVPDTLDPSSVLRMHPFFNQRNLYGGEVNKGVIKLDRDFSVFFQKFAQWKVRFETTDGTHVGTSIAVTNNVDSFSFAIPANLAPNMQYRVHLLGEQPSDPQFDPTKPNLTFTFRTSLYPTLAAKINALRRTQTIITRLSSDVVDMQAVVAAKEGFELHEVVGNKYTYNRPTIEGEVDLTGDQYWAQFIQPVIYPDYPDPMRHPDNPNIVFNITDPGALAYGAPPFKAITPAWFYVSILNSGAYNDLLKTRLPFVHNVSKYYNLHFLELRKKVINYFIGTGSILIDPNQASIIPTKFSKLVNQAFPFLLKGEYRVKFTLVQPDGTRGTTGEFVYENPID